MHVRIRTTWGMGFAAVLAACGGGDGGSGPNPSPLTVAKAPSASGDQQTGAAGAALAAPLQVVVTRDGAPQSGITVTWSTPDGGSLDPASGPTDASGTSSSTWTLGPADGGQTAQAAVQGAAGSPVAFSATAGTGGPPPPPPPSTAAVSLGDIFFRSDLNGTSNPAVDTVAVNGTVTWTWVAPATMPHTVQSTGATTFTSSGEMTGAGNTYQVQFTQAGTYTYNCAVHGSLMTGRIVVR